MWKKCDGLIAHTSGQIEIMLFQVDKIWKKICRELHGFTMLSQSKVMGAVISADS